jgi:GntR family transcriptional regulator
LLNSREATPLYQKLRDILRKQVEDGRYMPDHAIPSERDLCQQYQISRITLRQAIAGSKGSCFNALLGFVTSLRD